MSGLIVGLVMRHPVTKEFSGETKFVAMIYAEHAWPDGTHAYPAIETVAEIIGCSIRSVQRHVRTLEKIGMLMLEGKGPKGTNRYKFPLVSCDGAEKLDLKPIEQPEEVEKTAVLAHKNGGDNLSPRQIVTGGGDIPSGDKTLGDTGVTQLIKPLLRSTTTGELEKNVFALYQENFGALTSMIGETLADLEKTYSAIWVKTAMCEAVASEARNLKYVEAILRRWKTEGFKSIKSKQGQQLSGKSGKVPKQSFDQAMVDLQAWVES